MKVREIIRKSLFVALATAIFSLGFVGAASHASITDVWMISDSNFKKDTAGFLIPNSILPGEPVNIYTTCPKGSFTLQIFQMGYFGGVGAELVDRTSPIPCTIQSAAIVNPITRMHEDRWNVSTILQTRNLHPGFYLIRITADNGHQSFMNLVVRDQNVAHRLVISIPTLTDAAYNVWNGTGAYGSPHNMAERARVVALDQPNSESFGTGKYLLNIQSVVEVADRLHLNPAYVTDVDIATRPNLLVGATALISGGHDEYWTLEERESVLKARDAGTNLVFLGANVEYWRVRLSDSMLGNNRRMEIYKNRYEDPNKGQLTIQFRTLHLPESLLTGQMYRCFPASGLFTIVKPDLFIYKGIHLKVGDTFAGIIGPEVDNAPNSNSFNGKYVLAAKSPVTCGKHKQKPNAYSSFFYGVSPSGAGTISVGTMDWVTRGLTKEVPANSYSFVMRTTENILRESAVAPLGQLHPIK
ncbi:MAG: N,N-dimethylformamidase beta subunit family domain-containing protein [Actinomycetes bacterium]